jgi:hypothetical protein
MASNSYTSGKTDANGRRIQVPMEKDARGNWRPVGGYQRYQTSCTRCGRPNYSVEYSTCGSC